MIVAKPGIKNVKSLKGKKIGVEIGFVDHLLLLKALGGGAVEAIAAWQPNSGQALKALPGSKAIYSSANAPGLIYDVLAVSPKSLAAHRAEWKTFVKLWFKIAD